MGSMQMGSRLSGSPNVIETFLALNPRTHVDPMPSSKAASMACVAAIDASMGPELCLSRDTHACVMQANLTRSPHPFGLAIGGLACGYVAVRPLGYHDDFRAERIRLLGKPRELRAPIGAPCGKVVSAGPRDLSPVGKSPIGYGPHSARDGYGLRFVPYDLQERLESCAVFQEQHLHGSGGRLHFEKLVSLARGKVVEICPLRRPPASGC